MAGVGVRDATVCVGMTLLYYGDAPLTSDFVLTIQF